MTRRRLDLEMVRRDLTPNRNRAKALIDAGEVLVRGAVANKPAHLVAAGDPIVVVGTKPRFVSRGGDKLDAALT
ncbi:MAG: S4 domain-containing protein, partial [Actinomycetota bacterium]|nr:S4 domain-containing protein [Actinomycetota bacterium]